MRDIRYVHAHLPSADSLPSSESIAELHRALCRSDEIEREEQSGALISLRSRDDAEALYAASELLAIVDQMKAIFEHLETLSVSWTLELRNQIRQTAFSSELQAMRVLLEE